MSVTSKKMATLVRIPAIPALILMLFYSQALHTQAVGRIDLHELDAYIGKAMQEWRVPGLSIALVKDDSILYTRGYGVRKYGSDDPVDEHTVFSLASNSKPFTVAALSILNDGGKINWDDRVSEYLADFRLYDSCVTSDLRIRDLLCHRSGLRTFSGDLVWYTTNHSREEVLRRARYLEPAYGFRYRYGYSNIMFLAAGQIIPAVSGLEWEDFLKRELLVPLGMENTYLSLESQKAAPDIAWPHNVDLIEGTTRVIPHMSWENIAPAGALSSSAHDMSSWIRFQLNMGEWEGSRIISEETVWETRKMHTVRPVEMQSVQFWETRHFRGYGLGWDLWDYHGRKVLDHGGGSDGMTSHLILVPEEKLGFVILTNSINALPESLGYYILDMYFTGESPDWSNMYYRSIRMGTEEDMESWMQYKSAADPGKGPSLELQKYCGLYGGELYGNAEILLQEGQLVLDFLPSENMIGDLTVLEADTFLIKLREQYFLPEGTVRFYLDGSGDVREFMVDIPNPDFDFTELEFRRLER